MVLIKWIWPYIYPHIDQDQLGGVPGCSVSHYLIKMIHFIYSNLDNNKNPTAVIAALIDFSKAFNRMSHNRLVTILSDLNIPTCALRLVMSYLTNRNMCIRYKGAVSSEQLTPGGGPQGSLLIVLFFILQVNDAGKPCQDQHSSVYGPQPNPQDMKPCHHRDILDKKKYVDDLTLMEAIPLKKSLVPIQPFVGPLNFHERHGLHHPPESSILQHQLEDLLGFTELNKMKINKKKTKIMAFNFTKKMDFIPQLNFPEEETIDVIYETKLLGVMLTSDLSWNAHVQYISKRASKTLWLLIRFKNMGVTKEQLLTVYELKIRSLLEFSAPVFHSSLTKNQSIQIELVQKKALAIILGYSYKSYKSALLQSKLDRLDLRRDKLTSTFALKCMNNPRHSDIFPLNENLRQNMRNPKRFNEYSCKSTRFYKSAIPFMTRLLNNKPST